MEVSDAGTVFRVRCNRDFVDKRVRVDSLGLLHFDTSYLNELRSCMEILLGHSLVIFPLITIFV